MGKVFESIDEHQREWIARRELFFVGTAPLAADGRVNVSPKGPMGTFRVLGTTRSPTSTWSARAPRPSPTCARTGGSW